MMLTPTKFLSKGQPNTFRNPFPKIWLVRLMHDGGRNIAKTRIIIPKLSIVVSKVKNLAEPSVKLVHALRCPAFQHAIKDTFFESPPIRLGYNVYRVRNILPGKKEISINFFSFSALLGIRSAFLRIPRHCSILLIITKHCKLNTHVRQSSA